MVDRGPSPLKAALYCAAFLFLLTGCASEGGWRPHALHHAAPQGFQAIQMVDGPFDIFALGRLRPNTEPLIIYLEGDGAPWLSPYHPPRDPTPVTPTVLNLAMADPSPAVVYLGRPCQYLSSDAQAQCDPAYRDEARFAPEVLHAYQHILDQLKQRTGAQALHLVGYSGGGVLAALLAARRTDVAHWSSIGAPLALATWTTRQKISPLSRSLDPDMDTPAPPPGFHWIGARDDIVPPVIVQEFVARHGGHVRIVPGFTHDCCWVESWPRFLEEMRK